MSTTVWMNLATFAVSLLACYVIHLLLKKLGFGFTSVIALVIGIIIGLIFKGYTSYDAVVGTIYVKVITMMVIPAAGRLATLASKSAKRSPWRSLASCPL